MPLNLKVIFGQQPALFLRIEAGMVERLAFVVADSHAIGRPAGEEQDSARRRMLGASEEHASLVVAAEMKEAVPGDDAAEGPLQVERRGR